ncbi:PREDICTED: probable WRKY transcription factor 3 isoform X1 [Camelina sativa]|uniref:Probable WRKY transcription factor 3 isoform X1 n=1 Tax=Camelina sativa TaxID=90675 RepID=A0ABM0ZD70_CAMSA|nr:PREDICTED: probable WRKY transcription factor 3 isoform X1 [Camelina sativa]
MAEKKEDQEQPPSKLLKPSTGRPTISLPPRPFGEMFFSGGVGFSPGPMTLVSNLFSDPDELKSFSQLLAGAMASPAAAAVAAAAVVATAHHQTPVSSVGEGGGGDDVDPRFKQNRPTGLMITQPPGMFTVPPGLSPATLLDSPSFFGLFSPLQGAFGMTHQQALAQVTAQAVQGNNYVHMQQSQQSEYPSSTQQLQQQQQQASLIEIPTFSTEHRSQIPSPPVQDSSQQGQRETSDISVSEHRSQPQNADKPADDGYNWRKYGQKQVKGSDFPRSYYKCTHQACPVKKKVERSLDGQVTEIIYKGQHSHEPPQKRGNNNGSSKNSDVATQFQTSNSSLNKTKRDQETSQVTTTEQMSEASDGEEVGNAETSVGEKHVDEPDPKRRNTEVRVSEPVASSHKTVTEPRIIVQTTSEVDLLDDGYRWRKYGQKVVKGNPYPRSYYKCTTPACGVRKHVERAANDPKAVVTTYEGKHNHDVPAARTSSHQLRPNNQHNNSTGNYNQQQPVARLRLKEEI